MTTVTAVVASMSAAADGSTRSGEILEGRDHVTLPCSRGGGSAHPAV